MMDRPFVILGAGGHGRVVLDLLHLLGAEVLGFTDPKVPAGQGIDGTYCLGEDGVVLQHNPSSIFLALGVGGVGETRQRLSIFDRFIAKGYVFPSLVHPAAVVAANVKVAEGSQIMAGVVVQTGSRIGRNVILNTRTSIDHDCILDDHVHVAPGAVLSGSVRVCRGAHVGAGAVIIQGIRVGEGALIAAGAVVIREVSPKTRVFGLPAREK